MAEEKPPSKFAQAWQFTKQKLNHPPPKAAAPPLPPLMPTPAPGGQQPDQGPPSPAPINDPARGKLDQEITLRRSIDAELQRAARECQVKTHQRQANDLRGELQQRNATPIQRLAAEQELATSQQADIQQIDAYCRDMDQETAKVIADAKEAGHFTDELSVTFEQAATHTVEAGLEQDGGGGREIGI